MNTSRFLVEVRAVGLLKNGKKKIYMFSVSWSDQNNVLIYRALKEFKKLHKELKKKFPIQSGLLKKSDQTLPKFQGKNLMGRQNQKVSWCMATMKVLEKYCQDLLKTEAKISRGEDVIHFFEAQSRDLDPSFPENSVIILPSEMGDRTKETLELSSPTISQPVTSQSYRCMEAFETQDTKNRPFEAIQGEILEVLMKDKTGWWLVENDRKQIAWFPAPYLEEPEAAPVSGETSEEALLYFVTRAYRAKEKDELSVNIGVVVEVVEKSDNGWWLVWYNGKAGYVPSVFLKPYKNPHSKFLALANSGLCTSVPNLTEAANPLRKRGWIQQKGYGEEDLEAHSVNNMAEWKDTPPNRTRSRSLVRAAISGSTGELDSLSNSSGDMSEQGLDWPQKGEAEIVGDHLFPEGLQPASERHGDSCSLQAVENKQRSDSGFEEKPLDCSGHFLHHLDSEVVPNSPVVPPRPSPHEILQRCSTITKRAMQGAQLRPSLPASYHSRR